MAEDQAAGGYSAAERVVALLGLLIAGALVFILADVVSGGKLTGRDCAGCGDDKQEAAGA
jgi:hypothetical protein